jgi:ribosomal-protein-alanine N-acetyltransferase
MLAKSPISINRLQDSHAADLARLANNRKIWDNLMDYIPHPYTLKDAYAFIQSTSEALPITTFGIFHKKDFCGVISLGRKSDIYKHSAELGYWVAEPYWGKGIATQAIKKMVDYGFSDLYLRRIYANVFEYNYASMHVLEKNGFLKEGVLKKGAIKNDQIIDLHLYAKVQ